MSRLTSEGAAALARLVRTGVVSPSDVVDAHIARIEEVEPRINAFLATTFDEARELAQRQTRTGVPTDPPPLYGVPITIKDALSVAGAPFTAGARFRRDHVAASDAESVRRLKAAGAIVLGKTSCPDMSGSPETRNRIIGQTNNPWALDRSPGGSSGGEGAIIGAGGSPLGLGADIAGSVRLPAAFCGVFGLKPTANRISTDGHVPGVPATMEGWNTVGPLARRAEDLWLALDVLSETPTRRLELVPLRERPLVCPSFLRGPSVTEEVSVVVEAARDALVAAGMVGGERRDLPLLAALYESSAFMHREWLPGFRRDLGGGRSLSVVREMVSSLAGRATIDSNCLVVLASLSVLGPLLRAAGYGRPGGVDAVRDRVLAEMEHGALLLWPVFPSVAPPHGFSRHPAGSTAYTALFNGLGFPAASVPMGFDANGLPLAVQIIARPGDDEAALGAATVLEREFGGWRMATP